jgi:hypothetical protein
MHIDLVSDWPAYIFMALFAAFFCYIIVKGNQGDGKLVKPAAASAAVNKNKNKK